ncbi:DUF2750 domain-containing protein [Massilia sp. CFBP 13647]|nr:DUF2750 domain-containing protein [Massilia sp. CFBP 13647]MBD8674366.1 DUF2750 domain-containing protein [Massilia sp. CFBP 13721]
MHAMTIDSQPDAQADVLALPKALRYDHFIRRVADTGRVWGLVNDGWAIGKTDDGALVFPLWPTDALAQQCAVLEWTGYIPQEFGLQELLEELLPQLEADGILPGITYTPDEYGLTPSHAQLRKDLALRLRQRAGLPGQSGD